MKQLYGMTVDDYNQRLRDQGGVCAICKSQGPSDKRLVVDHDHTTGAVRGILCSNCNAGLGMLQDNATLLDEAAAYLRSR